ncbi:MAG: calcium-binding protein [Gammaproteobacteria bacterium]
MPTTTQDYAMLSSLPYGHLKKGDKFTNNGSTYEVLDVASSSDGYQGAIFLNTGTKTIIVANAGTQLGIQKVDIGDLVNDGAMVANLVPLQYTEASALMQEALDKAAARGITDVSTTGHSLGGSLSQLLAAQYGVRAETFNPYGVYSIAEKMGLDPDAANGLVTNHRDVFDVVSSLSKQIGTDMSYMTQAEYGIFTKGPFWWNALDGAELLKAHSLSHFWDDEIGSPGELFDHNYYDDARAYADGIRDGVFKAFDSFLDSLTGIGQFLIHGTAIEELAKLIHNDDSYRIVIVDPLALDLDGDGVVSTRKEADWQGVLFDEDGDGIKTATGWIGANDGLLVRDLNGNGSIDSGTELFGDQTVLADGTKAADGFQALAALDSNSDGVVDASDSGFASLQVWRDANGNGVTDAGELLSLTDLGITGFSVASTPANSAVEGGTLAATGSYTKTNADGSTITGVMNDFNLNNDTIHSQYGDGVTVPDAIAALADMQGIGKLRDLHEACALSPALEQAVRDFSVATSRADQTALMDNLLLEWAKTSPTNQEDGITIHSGGRTENPDSDHIVYLRPGQTYALVDTTQDVDVATVEKIRVVEAVLGAGHITDVWWGDATIQQYLQIYNTFFDGAYATLSGQTRLSAYIGSVGIQWSDTSNSIGFDFSQAVALLSEKFATDAVNGAADLIDLLTSVPLFAANKDDFTALLGGFLDKIDNDGLSDTLKQLYSKHVTADGLLSFALPASGSGSGTFILGNSAANNISGGKGVDFIFGGAGADMLNGGDGNDTLLGGEGNDRLYAGNGNDVLDGGAGDDLLDGGSNGANQLLGGAGNDVLTTGAYASGGNVLAGGTGDDLLNGSYYVDTYVYNAGDGKDVITELGGSDTLQFGEGIADDQLWFTRDGNDLDIQVIGTQDLITIKGWYLGGSHHVELFTTGDGHLLHDNQIDALVSGV